MSGKKGMKSHPCSPEARAKLRIAKLGKKLTPEHKAKISRSLLGNQYRKGIPHTMEMRLHLQAKSRKQTLEERFWSNVEKTDGCWLWTGYCFSNGYGRITIRNRIEGTKREVLVHRFAYELLVGPIPDGQDVLHKCDVRPCIRPDHFFLGTQIDNSADCVQKGRQASGVRSGHAKLTEEQVRAIRAQFAAGTTVTALVQSYPVTDSAIWSIVHNKTWKHLL